MFRASRVIQSVARTGVRRPTVSLVRRTATESGASAEAKALEERYPAAIKALHWGMAAGILGCFGTVKLAQNSEGDQKMELMKIHKSFGLLMLGLIVPRVGIRLASRLPQHVPGPIWERLAGSASHFAMYGMMIFMPVSGVVMGYFGGKGLPFFGFHIPGAAEPNGQVAKTAFQSHKLVGQAFEILVPLHVTAVGYHMVARQQNLLRRML